VHGQDYDGSNSGGSFVPVVVSDLRDDKDKAGQPALVVDCVFNTSIKSRLKDANFKAYIIELALRRVESHTSLSLSRQIGTPNIASKGKLASRQVHVPGLLFPPGHLHHESNTKTTLIQELASPIATASSQEILKSASTPTWTWTPTNDQRKIRFTINVPNLVSLVPRHIIEFVGLFPRRRGVASVLVPVLIAIIVLYRLMRISPTQRST
jgi:hypothetical protein